MGPVAEKNIKKIEKLSFLKYNMMIFLTIHTLQEKWCRHGKMEKIEKKLVSDSWKNFLLIEKLQEKGIKIQCRWMKKIKIQ